MYKRQAPFFEPLKLKINDVTPRHIQRYIDTKMKDGLSSNSAVSYTHLDVYKRQQMNREELIRFANEETGIPMKHIDEAISIFTDVITAAVAAGENVKLVGFGSFKVEPRAERRVTNPRTKEMMTIPAKRVVAFHPGTALTKAVEQ